MASFKAHSRFYTSSDGLNLHVRVHEPVGGDGGRLPVVCLPGLTRNSRDFEALAEMIAGDARAPRTVIAFDYRGRGKSDHDKTWENYTVLTEAQDVLAGLTVLDIEKACFIGTSRGGLIIHVLAGMRPGILGPIVLNDIGPVLGGAGLAQIRATLDRVVPQKSWDATEKLVAAGQARNFPALGPDDIARMTRAIFREEADGSIVPDYDQALLNGLKAIDFNQPLPDIWPQFAGLAANPVLVIRGEHSLLLSPETVAEMHKRHPRLTSENVAGQGHAPLLESGTLPATIMAFFNRHD